MTCGGCILGVKTALNKSKLEFVDKDVNVGTAFISFKKDKYNNKIDCNITKTIKKVTEFKVYLDEEFTKRACGS